MYRAIAIALEFDKIQQLVATQARTALGRVLVTSAQDLPPHEVAVRNGSLTHAVERFMDDDGAVSLAGIDEAAGWLEPGAPAPSEPRDLLSLLTLARRIATARARLLGGTDELRDLARGLPDTSDLIRRTAPRLGRDGTITDHASPELARLRRLTGRVRQELLQHLDEIRRAHPDITTDAPPTIRRDRYCLPVRSAARSRLPGLLLDTSATGATAFIEPIESVELNNQLVESVLAEREEIRRIVAEIAAEFAAMRDQLASAVDILALLDGTQARVRFGKICGGIVIIPSDDGELMLLGARHPLLDERLHQLRTEVFGETEQRGPDRHVVPLSFRLPADTRTLVISGPNAGGKTIVLKTLGLMVLMAAHGIPIPADHGSTIPRFDQVWCHIGDEQDVAADLSSFSGAMAATVRLLEDAGARSLVLYDELGAGTDPLEGAALGCALLETLTARGCLTVASTHLAAIALAAGAAEAMDNAAMGYDEESSTPTYTLTVGRPGRSRALEIAAKTGIHPDILQRARELLGGQHLELERWLRRLEQLEGTLLEQREQLAGEQLELRRLQDQTAAECDRLTRERERLPSELATERDRLRRRAKQRLDEALARLDQAMAEHERLGRRQRQRLRDQALALEDPEPPQPGPPSELEPGARVRLPSLGSSGVLEELRGSRARVAVDGKRLWVSADDLLPDDREPPSPHLSTVRVTAEREPGRELMLLGMDGEQARDELVRFLDQAFTAGRSTVRIVHGHGTGVLRQVVAEVCRSHPAVRSFRHPPQHLGGTGATEVELHEGA